MLRSPDTPRRCRRTCRPPSATPRWGDPRAANVRLGRGDGARRQGRRYGTPVHIGVGAVAAIPRLRGTTPMEPLYLRHPAVVGPWTVPTWVRSPSSTPGSRAGRMYPSRRCCARAQRRRRRVGGPRRRDGRRQRITRSGGSPKACWTGHRSWPASGRRRAQGAAPAWRGRRGRRLAWALRRSRGRSLTRWGPPASTTVAAPTGSRITRTRGRWGGGAAASPEPRLPARSKHPRACCPPPPVGRVPPVPPQGGTGPAGTGPTSPCRCLWRPPGRRVRPAGCAEVVSAQRTEDESTAHRPGAL